MAELLAANQITIAKVLDGEKGEMSAEQLAQLNQASEDASQAKSDVANLEIGGRNLLVGSESGIISNPLLDGSTATAYNDATLDGNPLYYMSGRRYIKVNFPTLKVGEQYTFSCDVARQSGGSSQDVFVSIGESTTKVGIASGGIWTNFNVTFTASDASTYALVRVNNASSSGRDDYIAHTRHFKLEKGNKATDWTPAPEDTDAGIANAAKVATNFLGYDSTNGLIIGNKTSGSWSGYRSQILPGSFNVLDTSSTVLASFGPTTVIGEEAKANMHLTFNNLSMVDKDGTTLFEVGDSRNADGIATLQWSSPDVPIGTSGSTTITVGNTISSIVSVSVDSVELSSSSYSFSGDEVTINNLTASSEKYIEIIYKTTNPVYYLTFGSRRPSAIIGERSVAEGRYVTASGFASHAEGVGTFAIGAYSHAEGHSTKAKAAYSHAGGYQTVADNSYMTAIGKYNTENSGKAFVVGVGDFINRRDGFTVDWDGNTVMKGGLTLGTALSIANGGTGATSLAGAQENLGIKAISERIDNLILGTGTSPVEVQDARLSSDGTRYPTLKSRLDAENSELKSDLLNNIHNCLCSYNKQDKIYGGITYTYNGDGSYTVTGSQSETSYMNLTDSSVGLPNGIIPGETYFYNFNDPTGTVSLDAWCDGTRLFYSTKPGFFTVPENAQSLYFRLTTWNADNINTTVKIPIVSTLKTLASDSISLPPDFYGESGSNSTLLKALSIAPKVKLLGGTYNIAVPINIPGDTTLEGVGVDATIINFTASTGSLITCESGNECIKNLTIRGGLTEKPSIYAGAAIKRGIVVQGEVNKPTFIENIKVLGFSKDGILVQNRGYISLCSIIANNIFMQYNGAGITFHEKGEYGVLTNSIAIDNYYGIIDSGGNNKISNCGFDRNTKGLYAGSVSNDTHSDIVGCSFNHCTSTGVECNGISSMLTFTACQFFGATEYEIFIYNAQAVSFVNCELGINAKLAFNKASKGDNFYALNNCIFGSTPNAINADVGTLLLITNCYTQNGIEVTN